MLSRFLLVSGLLTALMCTEATSARALRDSSGDAMQRHESRMMDSPLNRIPSRMGISLWPISPYYYAPPSLTVVNVEIHLPLSNQLYGSAPPPAPPARPKFWTSRCGRLVELEMNSTTNLMEEEQKPCS